jgi:hypothetical protein
VNSPWKIVPGRGLMSNLKPKQQQKLSSGFHYGLHGGGSYWKSRKRVVREEDVQIFGVRSG